MHFQVFGYREASPSVTGSECQSHVNATCDNIPRKPHWVQRKHSWGGVQSRAHRWAL